MRHLVSVIRLERNINGVSLRQERWHVDTRRVMVLAELKTGCLCEPADVLLTVTHFDGVDTLQNVGCLDCHYDFHFKLN